MAPHHPSPNPPRRILVRGVNWLGDAVMTTPALLRLREAFSLAEITLLTPAKLAELYHGHPAVNRLMMFENGEGAWRVARRLRKEKFDLGIALPNSPRSALELWLAQIPQRIGYAANWRRALLTRAVPVFAGAMEMRKPSVAKIKLRQAENRKPISIPPSAHHIYHYLHLLAELGCDTKPVSPLLVVGEDSVRGFESKFGLHSHDGNPVRWIGLNPGAEYGPAKRWPEERFIEAAIKIRRLTGCHWLVFGVKGDVELAARITDAINEAAEPSQSAPSSRPGGENASPLRAAINLAGKTSLGELCAGLKLCRAVLTNDSGPMHVAAALGTPVVVPFGSTSPELTGPGLPGSIQRNRILRVQPPCAPCFLRECPVDFRCMTAIGTDMAVEAVVGLI